MASSNRNINIHWYNEPHRSSEQNRVRRVGATSAEENTNRNGESVQGPSTWPHGTAWKRTIYGQAKTMEGKNTKGWQQRDYHREATLWLRLRYPDDEGWGERERGLTGSKRTQCSWSKMADKKELLRSHLETHKVLKNLMGDIKKHSTTFSAAI